jgi:hypothetical protein
MFTEKSVMNCVCLCKRARMRAHIRLYHYKPGFERAMLQHLFNRTFTSVVDFIYHKFYLRHVMYRMYDPPTIPLMSQ